MAENTSIEWCKHTFNPWIGCTKVSTACDFCYAEAWDHRFGGERWGPHADRKRTAPANWRKPLKWNREAALSGTRPRVFCASLADVFDNHKSIHPDWRADLWALIASTPHLDWLLLTKRPQNIQKYLPIDSSKPWYRPWNQLWPWPNVWLGTTVENQQEAERRIPSLLDVRARCHFLSCEPLLGPVDVSSLKTKHGYLNGFNGTSYQDGLKWHLKGIDWVIAGGENNPNFRPTELDWFRSLRDQCQAWNKAFLLKQFAGRNQREIKAKGRELDGVVHDAYPVLREAA